MAQSISHPLAEAGFVSPALSQRAVMFAGIVAFHVVLVYLFASGLAVKTIKVVFEPPQVEFIDKIEKPVERPVEQVPRFEKPYIDLGPPPDFPVNLETDSGTALTAQPTIADPPVVPPVAPPVEPIRLVGRHQLPNTDDFYPAQARRDSIEGATSIQVCVDEQGKRVGDPKILQSSGNAFLDKGALEVGRHGKYARSTRGGAPIANCYGFRIIFNLD
jgi:TonB family protein